MNRKDAKRAKKLNRKDAKKAKILKGLIDLIIFHRLIAEWRKCGIIVH